MTREEQITEQLTNRMRRQIDAQVMVCLLGGDSDATINSAGHLEKRVKGYRVDENESRSLISHD